MTLRQVCQLGLYISAAAALTACGKNPAPEQSDNTVAEDAASVATSNEREATDVPPTAVSAENPKLAVEAEGLRLFNPQSGAARPVSFGTPREGVLSALAFRGPPGTGANEECGAGPLDYANWPDGLGLFFQQGRFVGWNLDKRANGAITTASGIGPGSSRAELEAAYVANISETTLGTEFAAGEIFGLVDGKGPTATITNMWGGVSCNFR